MICVLIGSLYAADLSIAESKLGVFGRLKSVVTSVKSYLPSPQQTVAVAAGCTALYFMQDAASGSSHRSSSFMPTFNGTSTQALVQYQGSDGHTGFDQMACLVMTGLIGSFTGTISQLLMVTSCLAGKASAQPIPTGNCQYYATYLEQHPRVAKLLNNTPCGSTVLDLSNSGITDVDMIDMVPALEQLDQLNYIYLGHNLFGNIGMAAFSPVVSKLPFSTQTFTLVLNNNRVSTVGIRALATLFASSPGNGGETLAGTLDISNNLLDDDSASVLLSYWGNGGPDSGGDCFFLSVLNISGNNISSAMCSQLQQKIQQISACSTDPAVQVICS